MSHMIELTKYSSGLKIFIPKDSIVGVEEYEVVSPQRTVHHSNPQSSLHFDPLAQSYAVDDTFIATRVFIKNTNPQIINQPDDVVPMTVQEEYSAMKFILQIGGKKTED